MLLLLQALNVTLLQLCNGLRKNFHVRSVALAQSLEVGFYFFDDYRSGIVRIGDLLDVDFGFDQCFK